MFVMKCFIRMTQKLFCKTMKMWLYLSTMKMLQCISVTMQIFKVDKKSREGFRL